MEPARQERRGPDERSFEGLYRRHRAEVYRALLRELGNREDAEDVTQTAFLDAYRALARGNEPNQPRAWLLTIAENASRRRFRALGRTPEQAALAREPAAAEVEVTARDLRDGLDQLPHNQRAALVLREIGGFSYAEIASRLGLSVASVQMLLFRARRAFRAEFETGEPGRRPGAWLPWLGSVAGGGAASVVPRAAGLVAAGVVGATTLAGGAGPVPDATPLHRSARPRAAAEPALVEHTAVPVARAPARVGVRTQREPAAEVAGRKLPRPVPPERRAPAPGSPEPRETAAPPAPPAPVEPTPAPSVPVPAPAVELPTVALPPVEPPAVRAPVPPLELATPALPPTIESPVPAPPAGTGDHGGAALPGLPTS